MAAIYYEVLSEHIKQKIRQHTCSLDELKLVHENLKKKLYSEIKSFQQHDCTILSRICYTVWQRVL